MVDIIRNNRAVPKAWIVEWDAMGSEPAGRLSFGRRARARGFAMIRKAAGFTVRIIVQ